MKKTLITLTLLIITLSTFAQFKLSGKVAHLTKADTITLNIPFVYGYYIENDIKIPVSKTGSFALAIPLTEQKFGILSYRGKSTTILLTPGKQLTLTLDTNSKFNTFGGTAAEENRLLHQVKLGEVPFFSRSLDHGHGPFANASHAELMEQVLKPWFAMRDESISLVQKSNLSPHDKALISSEIKYNAYVQLNYFARGLMQTGRARIYEFTMATYAGAKPEPDVFPAGPQYYYYADSYLSYLDSKIMTIYGPDNDKSKTTFPLYYKMSLDSALKVVKLNGPAYIKWYLLNLNFSKQVGEQYLAQSIWKQWHEKELNYIEPLMKELKTNFPNSKYTALLQSKINDLTSLNNKNLANQNIKVFNGYTKVNSIYEVLQSFKGKVVYLDIWGTWCGPCKEELRYNPQLKARFKDKDVAFVYLDMDEDDKDTDWKTFIRVNELTGTHLRKNKAGIQKFWEELQPDKSKRGGYPSYFIFDKNGKLVQSDAKRPSDEAELYTQLEKHL